MHGVRQNNSKNKNKKQGKGQKKEDNQKTRQVFKNQNGDRRTQIRKRMIHKMTYHQMKRIEKI